MLINFTKMHGLGNDFVVIDGISQTLDLTPEQVRFMADRHVGIGFDQLLLVQQPDPEMRGKVDFKYRIFNADGSEVEQCGNGARCFAYFVRAKQLSQKDSILVATFSGIIKLEIGADGLVSVDMGRPFFEPEKLPFLFSAGDSVADNRYTLAVKPALARLADRIEFSAVSLGNPHITLRVDDLDRYPVQELGKVLESHASFPQRVNVGFMQLIHRQQIKLRVYERGTGETLACGTGACAAVANGISRGWLDKQVTVSLPLGELHIQWQGGEHSIMMTGPASFVYEGQIIL